MESIKVRQHVGQDGILHLDIPVGTTEQDMEVVVIYQSVPSSTKPRSLEQFYGICADEPIVMDTKESQSILMMTLLEPSTRECVTC